MTVATVRTIGTKRASTMVILPYLAKKASDFSMYSCLRNLAFGRLNTGGPIFQPIQKPTMLPTNAASDTNPMNNHRLMSIGVPGRRCNQQSGNEQQGVAREEEAEQDAAFGKDDQHDAEHGPRTHVADQDLRVEPTGQECEVRSGHGYQGYRVVVQIPV